jgi:biopolymer transport protein ExbD
MAKRMPSRKPWKWEGTEMELLPRKERRRPLELQLTAMIDIFSMIVIFLILGTVFGASEIILPKNLSLPRSISKEGVESAPRVVIERDRVTTNITEGTLGLELFRGDSAATHPSVVAMRRGIKEYLKSHPKNDKNPSHLLNIIADGEAAYRDIFDVVKLFREEGFETLLFVAMGEGKSR